MGLPRNVQSETTYWTTMGISDIKKEIRDELEQYGANHGHPAKLRYIFQRLSDLSHSADSESLMRSFIYTISALVHHLHHGGLQDRDIRRLEQLGRDCLRLQRIVPGRSKTSFLHGELHMGLSQVFAFEGNLWRASWDQLVAKLATRDEPIGGVALHEISMARRNLRLGFGQASLRHVDHAIEHAGSEAQKSGYSLVKVKVLRLSGQGEEAENLIKELVHSEGFTEDQRLELEWEKAWLRFSQSGDAREVMQMVGANGKHQSGAFVGEAKMLAFSVPEREIAERISRVSTYFRRGVLTPSGLGVYYRCLATIEDSYDTGIPSNHRLDTVATMLEQSSGIISIEKELLFLAAAARWLARSNFRDFAAQVLCRYRALSWSLTSGRQADVLGVVSDLMEKKWFS